MTACRLLDDNRELYVPELQEVIRPHPHFMLFATQNPAGAYAGRKFMSRAFRSRFLELHVGDIPDSELAHILHERCAIAPSHAEKLVAVMKELQRWRQVRCHSGNLHCSLGIVSHRLGVITSFPPFGSGSDAGSYRLDSQSPC